ncbi:hypothetical protein EKO27_g2681 [Xylaria grammica]|uniref:Transmembrane protein n=1 Tax=Xylaria grammica TaxID=363999 RepID=A0A439DDJ3_9PEZI|nr:hypothetical protein EKO27_g2681 [Xylaria grammica]
MAATASPLIGSPANENAVDNRHQSALSGEFQLEVSTQSTFRGHSHDSTNSPYLGWRPFYLRRFVLLGFILVFILIIVTIEALLAISTRDQGLVTTTSSKHYLWTYGPTAFLTALASIWARTEYQSKLAAPWMRLSQNSAPASQTIVLDYVSQFSPFAIFTALSKRDFIVSVAITVSVILKILITISTSLISLSWIGLNQNSYPMLLRDEFVDSNAKLATLSTDNSLATSMVKDLRNHNFTLPDGISKNYAFQSIRTDLPYTAETQVTVDGLVNSLQCEPVDVTLAGFTFTGVTVGFTDILYSAYLKLNISSPGCNVSLASLDRVYGRLSHNNWILFANFEQIQCDTIPGDSGKRVVVIFGNITYSDPYPASISRVGILNKSTNLLCVPEYTINRVQVTRNATRTMSVIPIPGVPPKRLESVTAWNIMEAQFIVNFSEASNRLFYGLPANVSGVPIDTDSYMLTAITSQLAPGSQAIDLFDVEVLRETAASYYRQIGAILAKNSLMAPTSVDEIIQGSVTLNTNRLMVRSWIAHWMVALVAVCIILTVIALFIVPSEGFLPYSPTNFPNLISILQQSHEFSA